VTSFNELRRDGMEASRFNLLHPTEAARKSFVEQQLEGRSGPVIAATDYIRNYADQIREYVPGRYVVLGTDGFGRSDSRAKLREFFEVDRHYVAVAALSALAREGKIEAPRWPKRLPSTASRLTSCLPGRHEAGPDTAKLEVGARPAGAGSAT
jgi:pyruvate dehydrogenase E1 component